MGEGIVRPLINDNGSTFLLAMAFDEFLWRIERSSKMMLREFCSLAEERLQSSEFVILLLMMGTLCRPSLSAKELAGAQTSLCSSGANDDDGAFCDC